MLSALKKEDIDQRYKKSLFVSTKFRTIWKSLSPPQTNITSEGRKSLRTRGEKIMAFARDQVLNS